MISIVTLIITLVTKSHDPLSNVSPVAREVATSPLQMLKLPVSPFRLRDPAVLENLVGFAVAEIEAAMAASLKVEGTL